MRRKAIFEFILGHTQNLVHVTTEKHLCNINHARYRFYIFGRAADAEKEKTTQHTHTQFSLTSKAALDKRK